MRARLMLPEYMTMPAGWTWKLGTTFPPPGSLFSLTADQNVKITHYRVLNHLSSLTPADVVVEVYVEEA